MDLGHHIGNTVLMVCRVGFVVYDNISLLDVAGPAEVFTTANQLSGESLYELQTVALDGDTQVRSESGLRLGVDVGFSDKPSFDTVVVVGGLGYQRAMRTVPLVGEIAGLTAKADRVTSVCTGAFLLAAVGVLDGRRATTHWAYAEELARRFPEVSVVADEIYVVDGPVMTAAGVAAGIDLALAIVQDDHGVDLARSVSRRMVVYLQRVGGQSQFSERFPSTDSGVTDPFDTALAHAVDHPDDDLSVQHLADMAAMSRRHFSRVFQERTGTTPGRWVERIRVDAARTLLEQGGQAINQIAGEAGFGSEHTMRQAFQRVVKMSPASYRAMHGSPTVLADSDGRPS